MVLGNWLEVALLEPPLLTDKMTSRCSFQNQPLWDTSQYPCSCQSWKKEITPSDALSYFKKKQLWRLTPRAAVCTWTSVEYNKRFMWVQQPTLTDRFEASSVQVSLGIARALANCKEEQDPALVSCATMLGSSKLKQSNPKHAPWIDYRKQFTA